MLGRARAAGLGRGDRLVVGFSGGRDSLALAAALRRVQAVLGVELFLVHVDHRLRPGSGEDAVQAERLAAALGLPCRTIAVAEPPPHLHPHVGTEEAARRERYRLLDSVACEVGARAVVTAHHEQDQAETVLLHVLRGAGLHGAVGMGEWALAPVGTWPANDISPKVEASSLWRPMLRESRAAVEEYVGELGLAWVEDPSNADDALRRNALRRHILPMLEEHFPGSIAALARYGRLVANDDEALDFVAETTLLETDGVDPGGRLAVASLRDSPRGLQRRMVRRWLDRVASSRSFTAERTDAVVELACTGRGGSVVEIGEGWTVRRDGEMLRAEATRSASEPKEPT